MLVPTHVDSPWRVEEFETLGSPVVIRMTNSTQWVHGVRVETFLYHGLFPFVSLYYDFDSMDLDEQPRHRLSIDHNGTEGVIFIGCRRDTHTTTWDPIEPSIKPLVFGYSTYTNNRGVTSTPLTLVFANSLTVSRYFDHSPWRSPV